MPAKKPFPPKPASASKDKKAKNKAKTKSKGGFKPPKPMNPTAVPPMLGF